MSGGKRQPRAILPGLCAVVACAYGAWATQETARCGFERLSMAAGNGAALVEHAARLFARLRPVRR